MNAERFERLFEVHAQPLFGFLLYRTGDRALAEDLVGDTFERIFASRRRYDPRRGSEKTWIYTIALNLLRDHMRRSQAEGRAVGRSEAGAVRVGGEAAFEAVDERDALTGALARLAPEEREAIALRYGADLTMPEMARLLGEKLTTVDGRVHRALRKLRREME